MSEQYDEFEFLHQCATKIQKIFRGFMARQFYQQIKQLIYYHYQEKQENIGYDMCFTEENQSDEYGFLQYKREYLQQPEQYINDTQPQPNQYPQGIAQANQSLVNKCNQDQDKTTTQRNSSKGNSYSCKLTDSKMDSKIKPSRKPSKQKYSQATQETKNILTNKMNEQDQVIFLSDVVSSHDSLIEAYKENMMHIDNNQQVKQTKNASNMSSRSDLSVKIHQMSNKVVQSNSQIKQKQILSPVNRFMTGVAGGQSPKRRPIVFEFDFYINAALLIQKVYRGFRSRKRISNYYQIKQAVLILETHLMIFLKRKMYQKRMVVKQLQVFAYNIQNQCRSITKVRDQVTNQIIKTRNTKLQQTITQTNQVLFDSFLQLFIPEYQQKTSVQKLGYIEKMKNFVSHQLLSHNQKELDNNGLKQEMMEQQIKSKQEFNKLQNKYDTLKKTHKSYLQNFIAQMKDVNSSQNISSITKNSHSSKCSILSENNQSQGNVPRSANLTTKQFHSLLMKQQFNKKKLL